MTDFWLVALFVTLAVLLAPSWRWSLLICVLVGFLQDPIRKLTPNESIYMTALVLVGLGGAWLMAAGSETRLTVRALPIWQSGVRRPILLFATWVVIQAGVTLVKTGNFTLAGIGLLAYFTPVPAILLGYAFARRYKDLSLFVGVYVIVSLVMTVGIYLSYVGYDWRVLESVGEGLFIYAESGPIRLHSGFLRSPEVAAWHAAAALCLIVALLHSRARGGGWLPGGAIAVFLVVGLLLTGRRKFIVEPLLFLAVYGVLLTRFRRGVLELATVLFLLGGSAWLAYNNLFPNEWEPTLSPYYERLVTVQDAAVERSYNTAFGDLKWVVLRNGILGAGAGLGSQGAQHFGGGSRIVGSAAEGGLAKVLAELGVPGLVLLLWAFAAVMATVRSAMLRVRDADATRMRIMCGLSAFLFANAVVFVTAHQVFGDLFVLTMLGLFLGFLMAVPQMQLGAGPRLLAPTLAGARARPRGAPPPRRFPHPVSRFVAAGPHKRPS